jgi:hypothetical protein
MEIIIKKIAEVTVPVEFESGSESFEKNTAAELKRLESVIEKQTISLFENLVRIQAASRAAGLPFSHKYINFYKALRANAKRTGITLPKKNDV